MAPGGMRGSQEVCAGTELVCATDGHHELMIIQAKLCDEPHSQHDRHGKSRRQVFGSLAKQRAFVP